MNVLCDTPCCLSACRKVADYLDSNFESIYLFYIKATSFIAHHRKTWRSFPPSTSKSLQLVFASILLIYGRHFTFFVTLMATIPAFKLFAWTRMKDCYQKGQQSVSTTDRKLRSDEEVVEWIQNHPYSDGTALYLTKPGAVRKLLYLMVAECESQILWDFFHVLLVCVICVYLVFSSSFLRNIMMSVLLYQQCHDMLFQSSLFHTCYYEAFQTLFEGQYAHWSKILVELRLFVAICLYIWCVSWLAGSFSTGMCLTFGCYLIVKHTVSSKAPPYNYVDSNAEVMNIAAWSFFFVMSLLIQWRWF